MFNVDTIRKDIFESMIVNGIPPTEADAQLEFWGRWGRRAYKSILKGEPCEPPTDAVIHAHGEQIPIHCSLVLQLFGNALTCPSLDGYNIGCFIPPHHFRALHCLVYTGYTMDFLSHIFRELDSYISVSACGYHLELDVEGMLTEDRNTRLRVAHHILEFLLILSTAECDKANVRGVEAYSLVKESWGLIRLCGDFNDDVALDWQNDIQRTLQGWLDELILHDIFGNLHLSSQARL